MGKNRVLVAVLIAGAVALGLAGCTPPTATGRANQAMAAIEADLDKLPAVETSGIDGAEAFLLVDSSASVATWAGSAVAAEHVAKKAGRVLNIRLEVVRPGDSELVNVFTMDGTFEPRHSVGEYRASLDVWRSLLDGHDFRSVRLDASPGGKGRLYLMAQLNGWLGHGPAPTKEQLSARVAALGASTGTPGVVVGLEDDETDMSALEPRLSGPLMADLRNMDSDASAQEKALATRLDAIRGVSHPVVSSGFTTYVGVTVAASTPAARVAAVGRVVDAFAASPFRGRVLDLVVDSSGASYQWRGYDPAQRKRYLAATTLFERLHAAGADLPPGNYVSADTAAFQVDVGFRAIAEGGIGAATALADLTSQAETAGFGGSSTTLGAKVDAAARVLKSKDGDLASAVPWDDPDSTTLLRKLDTLGDLFDASGVVAIDPDRSADPTFDLYLVPKRTSGGDYAPYTHDDAVRLASAFGFVGDEVPAMFDKVYVTTSHGPQKVVG